MTVRVYTVGGFVRDSIMGLRSKDIDYAVEASSYQEMKEYILSKGGEIFLESPEFVTVRARIGKETADYVLCRKDGKYSDGRHPDVIEVGTLYDDLSRRDFTMNAIAIAEDGTIIDPFGGKEDIYRRVILCVGHPSDRISEDYLRLVRAARFCITKNMRIHPSIEWMFDSSEILERLVSSVSEERIREEVQKMFVFDTVASIYFFGNHPLFAQACFSDTGIWLEATSKNRKR